MKHIFLLLLFALLVGCGAGTRAAPLPTLAPATRASPAAAEATQENSAAVSTLAPGAGVHTPDDLERYVAGWHEALKYRVNDEVVVLWTTWKDSVANWIGSVLIYHIPSMSILVLDRFGRVDDQYTHYESEEGQQQLEAVLANEVLMDRIRRYLAILEREQRAALSVQAFQARLEMLRFQSAAPE